MNDHDDRQSVYEIGYLIAASIPEEAVPAESDKVKKIINDSGASILSEEMPHRQRLAYTMRRKTVSGSYDKYDEAFFGWVKFELGSGKIEALKKAVESVPSVLRMLLITTVRENTYLGKRAPLIAVRPTLAVEEKKDAPPASIEEMDKSIDEMVKEV
jgi:ribosomal protein S6